jgi:hypothetical protein
MNLKSISIIGAWMPHPLLQMNNMHTPASMYKTYVRYVYKTEAFLHTNQYMEWRMPSCGMWRCVDIVWTDVSEDVSPPSSYLLTYLLTYGAEPFLRSDQLCSHSRNRLHLQGTKIRERGTSMSRWLQNADGDDVPPKRRFTQDLHSATSQKTAFFIVTALKTSNLTQYK